MAATPAVARSLRSVGRPGGTPRHGGASNRPVPAEREAAEEEEGEEGTGVEAVCLSQAWNLFEALMRQAPATQVLA